MFLLLPSPESVLQPSAPLPACFLTEVLLTKQADKRSNGAAGGLSVTKVFRPRLTFRSYIVTDSWLKLPEISSYFESLSAGMEDLDGRLRRKIRET